MNPLKQLLNNEKPYRVADKIGMPRNTLYRMMKDELPKSVRIETIEKIAGYFGYQVEIKLVRKDDC